MFILILYLSAAICTTIFCVLYNLVKVKVGRPPIGVLFIAYKYLFSGKNRKGFLKVLKKSPIFVDNPNLIKLCYFNDSDKKIEYAEGIIITGSGRTPDSRSFFEMQKAGLSFFTAPKISHALYLEFPVFLWYPLAKLLAVLICYPRIKRFSQEHSLCGYPVIEIYSKSSVLFVVPLEQQDCFVVREAEPFVFGKYFKVYEYKELFNVFLRSSLGGISLADTPVKSPKVKKRITRG